jgi:arylsulfatase A-like enzyme|eukprot:COSAG02_NODE_51_length_44689_cov_29.477361_23_plen_247_part_00
MSNFDGGIRVGSFIAGGVIPEVKRGTKYTGLVGLFDWYTTLCSLAGVSAVDHQATKASLPPVDGLDLSAALLGVVDGPMATAIAPEITHRNELAIGTGDQTQRFVAGLYMEGPARSDGTRGPLYKLLLGTINQNAHSGPLSPNRSMNATLSFPSGGNVADWTPDAYALDCGDATGCLWDVRADPEEREDLARGSPPPNIVEVMRLMRQKVEEYRAGALMRIPGPPQPAACAAAMGEHRGYWGPFSK